MGWYSKIRKEGEKEKMRGLPGLNTRRRDERKRLVLGSKRKRWEMDVLE